jgi:N-acetyl-gamma-glutamyl-phosphate reductase
VVVHVKRVLVAGASGYAGALAARLVQRHPQLELAAVTSRSDVGKPLRALYPHHRVDAVLEELDVDGPHGEADAAIVAYPHGAAGPAVAALRERGVRVIDLSADFRLRSQATYEDWYVPHPAPELLPEAVYGLPERYREQLREAELVANPGCSRRPRCSRSPRWRRTSPTWSSTRRPASAARAARRPTPRTSSRSTRTSALQGRRAPPHPEIEQELVAAGGPAGWRSRSRRTCSRSTRASCCRATCGWPTAPPAGRAALAAYAAEPWVELVDHPPGRPRRPRDEPLRAARRRGPADGRTMVFAAIDNLWKGTSSQAVQSLNLMLGFDETDGLR